MNNRLDRRTDDHFAVTLKETKASLDAYKVSNQLFSSDSIKINRLASGHDDATASSVGAGVIKRWRVVFVYATKLNQYVDLAWSSTLSNADGNETMLYWPDTTNTTQTQRSWQFVFQNGSHTQNVAFRFILKCADTGTMTVTAI